MRQRTVLILIAFFLVAVAVPASVVIANYHRTPAAGLDYPAMLAKMLPGGVFTAAPGGAGTPSTPAGTPMAKPVYLGQDGRAFTIEQAEAGFFTGAGANGHLVVVSWKGQAHAEGFYNVAAAVFDAKGKRLTGEVLYLTADEGRTVLFTGKGRTYPGYAGSTTYQGSSEWHGGLYAAGAKWEQLWPADPAAFWRDRAAEVTADGFTVYERVPVPGAVPGQTIPDYQSVLAYHMVWDPGTESLTQTK